MEGKIIPTYPEHTKRGLPELLTFFIPIFTLFFIPCLVGFFERICLSRYSLEALEGSIQAIYLLQIFQYPLINFASMTPTFIGKHLGAGEPQKVGPCIWQMGWISLLSMLLIIPVGILASSFFFTGKVGGAPATTYFNILLGINFLFPLATALSSFYLVQERIYFIIRTTLIACGLTLLLDFVLILGIPPILPPLGILGASLGTIIGRLVFCGILFVYFLKQPNLEQYRTDRWKIDFSTLRHYLRVCTPRAAGRVFALFTWALTSHFMAIKEGDYLLVLSIGGTVILFCYFFADSMIQALTLIFSRYLGAQQYQEIWKSWRAGLLLITIVTAILSVPLLLFPDVILSFFFTEMPVDPLREYLQKTLHWVWGWVLISNLAGLFFPFILAKQDTLFYMIVTSLSLFTSTIPVYFFIHRSSYAPDKFWLILMLEQGVVLSLYICRVFWFQKTQVTPQVNRN